MAATVEDVRYQVGDTVEPYLFTDSQIQDALDEAAALLSNHNIGTDDTLGEKSQRLMAAVDLLDTFLTNLRRRPAASLSESGAGITFVDLQRQKSSLDEKLQVLMSQIAGCPFEAVYDNY